jgi:hypothetical protein
LYLYAKPHLVSGRLEGNSVLLMHIAGTEVRMCLPAPFVVELDADVVPRDALTEQDDLLAPGGGARRVGDVHDLQLTLCLHKELLLSHVTRILQFSESCL